LANFIDVNDFTSGPEDSMITANVGTGVEIPCTGADYYPGRIDHQTVFSIYSAIYCSVSP